jgi:glycolate oxidase
MRRRDTPESYPRASTPPRGPSAAAPPYTAAMAAGTVTEPFIDAVRAALPTLRLLTDPTDREAVRRDETAYLPGGLPGAVAFPTETAQVAELVRICARFDVPIVPRGAGSGLSGGANGIDGAVTIVFTAMDRILEIDAPNLCVVTQPGIINARLKAAVAEHGLFYAPDPASFEMCSIGGNLGTNAGGLCCVKYGQTRDSVLGLEVVMADGSVVRTGGKNVKDVAGYALTQLLVGSQGTLGLITEATLRLRSTPPPRITLLAFFPTLESAGDGVAAIAAAGLSPVTLELLDRFTIRAVDDMHALGLDRDAAAMLMVESDLPGAAATDELERGERACLAAGATSTVRSADAAEADLLRQARRAAHWALERLGDVKMEDIGVPRSRVPDMLRAIERIAATHDVRIGTFGHVGDGNLHPDLVLERGDPRGEAITAAVQADLYRAALDLGGTVTAEHGIGSARQAWLEPQVGAGAIRVMRAIKTALDPQGLFNPGRVLHDSSS